PSTGAPTKSSGHSRWIDEQEMFGVPEDSPPNGSALPHRAQRRAAGASASRANDSAAGQPAQSWDELTAAPPARRAQRLANALNVDRALPEITGQPVTLGQCLAQTSGANRPAVIGAYWSARQQLARYQVFATALAQLERLAGSNGGVTNSAPSTAA